MKRKLLALTLAVSMIAGLGASAMAAEHEGAHGTKDSAAVGEQKKMETEKDNTVNYRGSTQFYINVDKDGTDGPIDIPDPEDVPGAGGICHYEIGWLVNRSTNVSVTVPLYVCMYGYGGNGKVVAPTGSAYHMENESYYTDKRTVDYIYACYDVENILSEAQWEAATYEGKGDTYEAYIEGLKALGGELADLELEPTKSEKTSGEYGYINMKASDEAEDNYKIYRLSDCDLHTDTRKEKCDQGYFYRDTTDVVESVEVNGETITMQTVQYAGGGKANEAPLPINVPTIKVEAYTWAIRPTSDTKDLKAGEIAMTVNGLDLSKVYESDMTSVSAAGGVEKHTLDIKDLNWFIAAPVDESTPGTLDLPVYAAIAGGSVNEEGCVPVVRVTYTVAPALDRMETGNYQTQTAG